MRLIINILFLFTVHMAFAQGDYELAEQMYADADYEAVIQYVHSFEIRHVEDLRLEADAYHKMGEYEAAEETYTQVLARDEADARSLMRRGAVYLEMGEFGFALKDTKKALKLWPEHPEANFHMGNICYDQSDMRNAVKYYERAIDLRPGYPQATYMLGAARSEMGHYKDASKAFVTVMSELPAARYNLAVVALEEEKYQQAIDNFDAVVSEGFVESADLYFFRAEAHFFMKNKHAACMDYNRAASLGDEEAKSIYDGYCMKNYKKAKRKDRGVQRIDL